MALMGNRSLFASREGAGSDADTLGGSERVDSIRLRWTRSRRDVFPRFRNSASRFALLDFFEVVSISFASTPEEVLALLQLSVEVKTEFVFVTWTAFLRERADVRGGRSLKTNDFVVLRTADTCLLNDAALVAVRTVRLRTVHRHAQLCLQWFSLFAPRQAHRRRCATLDACVLAVVVVPVPTAARVREPVALRLLFVVVPPVHCRRARPANCASHALFRSWHR